MGTRQVGFASERAESPAQFYFQSYPAHTRHLELGAAAEANRRTIHQFIYLDGTRTCQHVISFAELHAGCGGNTFPRTPTTDAVRSTAISTSPTVWSCTAWVIPTKAAT